MAISQIVSYGYFRLVRGIKRDVVSTSNNGKVISALSEFILLIRALISLASIGIELAGSVVDLKAAICVGLCSYSSVQEFIC